MNENDEIIEIPCQPWEKGFTSIVKVKFPDGRMFGINGWGKEVSGIPHFAAGPMKGPHAYFTEEKDKEGEGIKVESGDWLGIEDGLYRIDEPNDKTWGQPQLTLIYGL